VPLLEAAGHSSFDARAMAPEGSADDALFRLAQERQAVLLPTDKDFFHAVQRRRDEDGQRG
jgi:hypothetical protein